MCSAGACLFKRDNVGRLLGCALASGPSGNWRPELLSLWLARNATISSDSLSLQLQLQLQLRLRLQLRSSSSRAGICARRFGYRRRRAAAAASAPRREPAQLEASAQWPHEPHVHYRLALFLFPSARALARRNNGACPAELTQQTFASPLGRPTDRPTSDVGRATTR